MSEPIEAFYERELVFLEETAQTFAERYPANAKHLILEGGRSVDPHLERLIEGFALLTGRVRHKLDDEFPELIESLLQLLYPHLGLIIPSMAIAQARVDEGSDRRRGWELAKGTQVRSGAFGPNAETLQYSVGYPVTFWPVELLDASWEPAPFATEVQAPPGSAAILHLRFSCLAGLTLDDLPLDKLRLYLSGERQLMADLYECLFNRCLGVLFRPADADTTAATVRLQAAECLFQVGLELEDWLLPFPPEAFVGYRLLLETLSFPQKFLFADLGGWERLRGRSFGSAVDVLLFFSHSPHNLEHAVSPQNFLLGCTPVVNVFPQSTEPIAHNHRRAEYRVVPSRQRPRGMEVYRVESVRLFDADVGVSRDVLPFYARSFGDADARSAHYHVTRRASPLEDVPGTEVYVTVVDPEFHPNRPSDGILDVHAWCTNRDQPFKYQQAGDRLTPPAGAGGWLELLHKPTPPLRRTLRRAAYWRLLGQNALNHVSLIDGKAGLQALRELLSLCDFSGAATQQLAAVNQQIIDGIKSVRSRPVMARAGTSSGRSGPCRGMEVVLEFDEEKYTGVGVLLVASVLERFLALYTGVNSFTKLIARTAQAEGDLKIWPPRAGADLLP